MMSGICISSQLCISQGYWKDVALESRQLHKQCFSPFLVPLFSQKHSCTALPERWGEGGSRQCRPLIPPGVSWINGTPVGGCFEWTDARAALCRLPSSHSEWEQRVPWDWEGEMCCPASKSSWRLSAGFLVWPWQWLNLLLEMVGLRGGGRQFKSLFGLRWDVHNHFQGS